MIVIKREAAWTDKLRKYIVVLNDQEIGSFGENETFDYRITPGLHTLYLKVDWCRSKKIQFEIQENEVLYFTCRGLSGFQALFPLWYITVKRNDYMRLEQVDNR